MGVADRLYETACECRDLETKMDAVLRDCARQKERADRAEDLLGAYGRAAGELLEAIHDLRLSGNVTSASVISHASNLKNLIS